MHLVIQVLIFCSNQLYIPTTFSMTTVFSKKHCICQVKLDNAAALTFNGLHASLVSLKDN